MEHKKTLIDSPVTFSKKKTLESKNLFVRNRPGSIVKFSFKNEGISLVLLSNYIPTYNTTNTAYCIFVSTKTPHSLSHMCNSIIMQYSSGITRGHRHPALRYLRRQRGVTPLGSDQPVQTVQIRVVVHRRQVIRGLLETRLFDSGCFWGVEKVDEDVSRPFHRGKFRFLESMRHRPLR